jgi:hypothetical protein
MNLIIPSDNHSRSGRQFLARSVSCLIKMAQRDAHNAILFGAEQPLLRTRRFKGRLKPAELKRVNALLDEIDGIMNKANTRKEGRMMSITYALAPLETGE